MLATSICSVRAVRQVRGDPESAAVFTALVAHSQREGIF